MPGLSFGNNQSQNRRAGSWWVPLVLIVISVALVTLCVRFDNGGPFVTAREAVHTVSKPLESLCAGLSTPLDSISSVGKDDELTRLEQENNQLRTLVAELEEYRQQDQRLTALTSLADMYGLETVGAEVTGLTTGWDRTATLSRGSDDGIKVGMGVMSSCGLYGQVESTTATTSTVRLVNDSRSSVSAMLQGSRARGILSGSYDGTLTLDYVSVSKTVGEGDIVISSGEGGTYPRGLVIGTVTNIETDSSKLYYRITVEPIYNIEACEEVMVLTGNESSTQSVLDKDELEEILNSAASPSAVSSQEDSSDSAAQSSSDSSSTESSDVTASTQSSNSSQSTSDSSQTSSDSEGDSDE